MAPKNQKQPKQQAEGSVSAKAKQPSKVLPFGDAAAVAASKVLYDVEDEKVESASEKAEREAWYNVRHLVWLMELAAYTLANFLSAEELARSMYEIDEEPRPTPHHILMDAHTCRSLMKRYVIAFHDVDKMIRSRIQLLEEASCHTTLAQEQASYRALLEAAREVTVDPIAETFHKPDDTPYNSDLVPMPSAKQVAKLQEAFSKLSTLGIHGDPEELTPGWKDAPLDLDALRLSLEDRPGLNIVQKAHGLSLAQTVSSSPGPSKGKQPIKHTKTVTPSSAEGQETPKAE